MSALQAVENYLAELSFLTVAQNENAYVNPTAIVQDLQQAVIGEINEDQLGLVSSLIFTGENSILRFLEKSVMFQDKKFVKTKENMLIFLDEFITLLGKRVQDYALDIKQTCLNVFRREQSNTVKQVTFSPIIKLIKLKLHILDADKLGVKDMCEMLIREYISGKASQTVKANMLQLLGFLCESFPGAMYQRSSQLLQIFLDSLNKQFKSEKPDMKIISGGIQGLCSLLVHFEHNFLEVPKNAQLVYKYISLALEPPPHLLRYEIPKSALKFVTTHGFLIKEYLTEDSEKMYKRLVALCTHKNRKVQYAAFPALKVFFKQVAGELVSGNRSFESNKETFKFFMKKFFELIDGQTGGVNEVSIGIVGFGHFAAPIQMFLGTYELKKVLNRLFTLSERYISSSPDHIGDTIQHLSGFILSFANILLELNTADAEEHYLDHLEKAIGAFFIIFPQLYKGPQRQEYYEAISRLFISLYPKGSALSDLLSRIVFQGLTLTCAQSPNTPLYGPSGELRPEQQYFRLWQNLLEPVQILDIQFSPENYRDLRSTIYDQLMQGIIKMLRRLNIGYTVPASAPLQPTAAGEAAAGDDKSKATEQSAKKGDLKDKGKEKGEADADDEKPAKQEDQDDITSESDPTASLQNLQPNIPKDYELFLNLVEFCKVVLLLESANAKDGDSGPTPAVKTEPDIDQAAIKEEEGAEKDDKRPKKAFFTRWVYLFGREVISRCNEYPLVSGFYKLLSITFKNCETLNYFQGIPEAPVREERMEGTQAESSGEVVIVQDDLENKRVSMMLFKKFIAEILVRIQQYKDELLAACIELLLSVPKQFVELDRLVPAIQTAFRIGLSYIPLAQVGLNALEHWLEVLPKEMVAPQLAYILPSLNDYLSKDWLETREKALMADLAYESAAGGRRNRAYFIEKLMKKEKQGKEPAAALQYRIIRLLGRLGGDSIHLIGAVNLAAAGTESEMAWDTVPRVKFAVPFHDMKSEIYLDALLPRIVELAENASERQTKVAACELLHAVVLYMVGTNAHSSRRDEDGPTPFYKIYQKIFPSLIQLAVDIDPVTRQLFEPLLFQLIHWFTKNATFENAETMALLDAIVTAVGNDTDGALRDFAAKCLAEFLKWSIKQTTTKKQQKAAVNTKSLLKRLYGLARHPNPYRRLGSALTFQHIYRVFRIEPSLTDVFGLEVLHNIIFSLSLAHHDDASLGTADRLANVILAFARVLARNAGALLKPNTQRRQHPDLREFIDWLFTQTGAFESRCRMECMSLMNVLCPALPGVKSAGEWIQQKIEARSRSTLISIFEVTEKRIRVPAANTFSRERIQYWLTSLHASLDCYVWLFAEGYAPPQIILDEPGQGEDVHSQLLSSLRHFTTHFAITSEEVAQSERFKSLTPRELETYNELKTSVISRLFHFWVILLEKYSDSRTTSSAASKGKAKADGAAGWLADQEETHNAHFFRLLFSCMLCPTAASIGYTFDELESRDVTHPAAVNAEPKSGQPEKAKARVTAPPLRSLTTRLCKLLQMRLPEKTLSQMRRELRNVLAQPEHALLAIDFSSPTFNIQIITLLIHGYEQLHECKLLIPYMSSPSDSAKASALGERLIIAVFDHAYKYDPLQRSVAGHLLQLALSLEVPVKALLKFLLDKTVVQEIVAQDGTQEAIILPESTPMDHEQEASAAAAQQNESTQQQATGVKPKKSTKGELFYKYFQTQIDAQILIKFEDYVKPLMSLLHNHPIVFHILLSLIDKHIKTRTVTPVSQRRTFLSLLLAHLQRLGVWTHADSSREQKECALDFLQKLLMLDSHFILSSSSSSTSGSPHDAAPHVVPFLCGTVVSFLERTLPLSFKNQVFDLLPYLFNKHLPEDQRRLIKDKLVEVAIYDFPTNSKDVPKGSIIFTEYINALNKLLRVLVQTGSVELLHVLFPILREQNHVHEGAIAQAIQAFITRLSSDDAAAEAAFTLCFEAFLDVRNQDHLRFTLVTALCVPIIHVMPTSLQMQVFSKHICTLMDIVLSGEESDKSDKGLAAKSKGRDSQMELEEQSEEEQRSSLIQRICAFSLVEALYASLPGNTIRKSINTIYAKTKLRKKDADIKGNELTSDIMRATHAIYTRKGVKEEARERDASQSQVEGLDAEPVLADEAGDANADDKSAKGPLQRLLLELNQTAYCALASVIRCTQTKENFFNVFLFKESWDNIIDLKTKHQFPVETNFPVAQQFVASLRVQKKEGDIKGSATGRADRRYMSSQYFADSSLSQDVSQSSFFGGAEENQDSQTNEEVIHVPDKAQVKTVEADTGAGSEVPELELDALNSNPCMPGILAIIDYLVSPDFAAASGGESQKEASSGSSAKQKSKEKEVPKWMAFLLAKITAAETHGNVRQFIAKVVLNRPDVFKDFASTWFEPLARLAVSKDNGGSGFNYFVRDICLLFLRWNHFSPAAHQKPIVNAFMEYLIRSAAYPKPTVGQANIEIIKLFFERWKGCFDVSKKIIVRYISYDLKNKNMKLCRVTGLQLLGIIIANGFPPYDPKKDGEISEFNFFERLLSNLTIPVKQVYCATAEVCGLALKQLWEKRQASGEDVDSQGDGYSQSQSSQSSRQTHFEQLLQDRINGMFAKAQHELVLNCLTHVAMHFPPFLDKFFLRLFDTLPKLTNELKEMALQLILLRTQKPQAAEEDNADRMDEETPLADKRGKGKEKEQPTSSSGHTSFPTITQTLSLSAADDSSTPSASSSKDPAQMLFIRLQPVLPQLLTHRDEDSQLLVIKIIYSLLPSLTYTHVLSFLEPLLLTFAAHSNDSLRAAYYDIIVWLYENSYELKGSDLLREYLLRGLTDSAKEIREKLLAFWDDQARLDYDSVNRLKQTLTTLYSPDVESSWLHYATYLLLSQTTRSPDFERTLFEPLTDCEFKEYNLDFSGQGHSFSHMTPFYSQGSQQSLSQGSMDDMSASQDAGGFGGLKATQTGHTYGTNASVLSSSVGLGFNWMELGPTPLAGGASTQGGAPSSQAKRSMHKPMPVATFRRPMEAPTQPGAEPSSTQGAVTFAVPALPSSGRIPRRFAATPAASQGGDVSSSQSKDYHYSHSQYRRRKKREATRLRQKESRKQNINIIRKYRVGELPDVQIKPSELIAPLQVLAQRDPSVARIVFSSLFEAVLANVPEDEREETRDEVQAMLQRLLSRTRHDAAFVACIHRICFQESALVTADQAANKKTKMEFEMPPALVGDTSMKSLNFHTGVMLLEKQILKGTTKRVAKRRKGPSQQSRPSDTLQDAWGQLARLYKSLGEEDVLLGLYEKHISRQQLTKQALEAELQGDYIKALNIYEEATQHAAEGKDWGQGEESGVAPTEQEMDLWENGRLECLAKLTKWDDLAANTLEEVEHNTNRLFEDRYADPYLSYFIVSHSKVKQRWPDLWQFVDTATNAPPASGWRSKLESEFLPELALVSVTRDDLDRARYYINQYFAHFLSKWASLHPLAHAGRHLKLQSVQRVVELEEFLDFVRDDEELNFATPARVEKLLTTWRARWPSPKSDSINVWDDVVTTRALLLEKLNERFAKYWEKEVSRFERLIEGRGEAASSGTEAAATGHAVKRERTDDDNDDMVIVETQGVRTLKRVKQHLLGEREAFYRQMADGARKQSNFYVADMYMKLSLKAGKALQAFGDESASAFNFSFFHSLVKLYCLKAKSALGSSTEEGMDKFIKALRFVLGKQHEQAIHDDAESARRYHILMGRLYQQLSDLTLEHPIEMYKCMQANGMDQMFQLGDSQGSQSQGKDKGKSKVDTELAEAYRLEGKLTRRAYKAFHDAAKVTGAVDKDGIGSAKAHYQLAKFCDDQLKHLEAKEQSDGALDETKEKQRQAYSAIVIENTLQAMRLQNSHAADRFPRLLEILSTRSGQAIGKKLFMQGSKKVPCWMFIRWISQMMALLDKEEGPCVVPILTEIAREYPQALYFPFRISTESFAESASESVAQVIAPLKKLLHNTLLDRFVDSLEKLTNPEHRWKDWTEELMPLLRDTRRDPKRLKALFAAIHKDVFDPKQPGLGAYNKKFAANWEPLFKSAFGADGSTLVRMKYTDFAKLRAELWGKMEKKLEPKRTQAMKLQDFSTWLAEFEQGDLSSPEFIELPGQYSGLCKPQPELHVRVSSFDPKILVMGSLRRPKRLKIHGNDEKDYPYLVKGGEDLRLDQRVQQLFSVMNEIFIHTPATCKRRLAIKTYQVVPMTGKVGMIEWLNDTRPLKEIVEEELARDERKRKDEVSILRIPAAQAHNQWIQSYAPKASQKTLTGLYYAMFANATREDTIKKVASTDAMVRWDLLKRGIQALSKSPEAYLAIRAQFARTLSTFNVASYIIGIGDRHLENFLLDHKTGGLIGIDFGHAFGSATQFLPIPELIPFRLTRQLTNFLLPLDADGLLKHNMVHTMSALAENRDMLLNVMDVFIKEPLMDWEKLARRLVREQNEEDEENEDPRSWFPKEKIAIAKKKLEGYNPAHITVEELAKSVHAQAPYLAELKRIVRGVPKDNVRARTAEKCGSVKEQVDCLVDQATDPNILGRTYGGWAPWV